MLLSFALTLIEKILNNYLRLDPELNKRLNILVGKVVLFEPQPFHSKIYWLFTNDKIHLQNQYAGTVNVTLTGSLFDFLRLGTSSADSATLFASKVTVLGDTEVAQQFNALFAHLDIDWEEKLAGVTGDVIAHQVGTFFGALSNWAKQSSGILQKDLIEYVQEEARWLPPREELQDLFTEIDTLRNDTERLAARIKQLQKKFS